MSLATQVLIGVGLGIVSGIFFGEKVAFIKIFGDAFIQLLQMTVLPYVMISLIVGLGGLSYRQAATLARLWVGAGASMDYRAPGGSSDAFGVS